MARRREQRTGLISFVARWIRRIQRVLMVLSIAAAVYRWWLRRQAGPSGGGGGSGRPVPILGPTVPSAAQPLPAASAEPELVGAGAVPHAHMGATQEPIAPTETSNGDAWVQPLGGECPATHPIKVNDSSGIFHKPGGRFYARTEAVRCYSSPEAATADGYRAAKA